MHSARIFKDSLIRRERQVGFWNSLGCATATEIVTRLGFDWILIDMEHSPIEIGMVLDQMRSMLSSDTTPLVRPPSDDPIVLKRLCDIGVQVLLIPMIETAEQARAAVAAVHYPPAGRRGFSNSVRANGWGTIEDYAETADSGMCVLVQIETQAGVANLEDIAAVEGVDGIFVGPADLAANMGYRGKVSHPKVQQQLALLGQRIRNSGKPAGTLLFKPDDIRAAFSNGYTFVAVGSDISVLRNAALELWQTYREQ